MGAKEKNLADQYLAKMPETERMFRANSGMAWTGKVAKREGNFLILQNPRPFKGLPEGFSDYFGWETVEVTQEMVGQKVAIAKTVEVKATGKLTRRQSAFRDMCISMGVRHVVLTPENL
jgi:hypothetical protein